MGHVDINQTNVMKKIGNCPLLKQILKLVTDTIPVDLEPAKPKPNTASVQQNSFLLYNYRETEHPMRIASPEKTERKVTLTYCGVQCRSLVSKFIDPCLKFLS